MSKTKVLAVIITALLLVTSVIPVFADDTTDLPILISPNPSSQKTEETQTEQTEETQDEAKISFTDISDDASYKEAVYKLVANGVLNGYPDGTFKPIGNLTRAEMCKMINLTFGYTDIQDAAGFPDLVEGEWYVPYVLAAQKAGYIKGDAIGTFRPNDMISRQEVCAILYRVVKPYDLPIPVQINDKVDDWAKEYVEAIVKNALMPLEEGGIFRATEPIKRHELASAVAPHSSVKVEDIKCKVTFKNGEEILEAAPAIGKALETLPTPTVIPEGYAFAGWSLEENGEQTIKNDYIFFSDTILYACFVKAEYEVVFMAESEVVSTQKVKHGEKAQLPEAPSKGGYKFKGWVLENGKETIDIEKYEVTSNVKFYASFTESSAGGGFGGDGGDIVVKYKVYFKSDSKTVDTQSVEKGKFAQPPKNPELNGADFLGWSLKENGEIVTVENHAITKETTFYAVFENPNDPEMLTALQKAIDQFNDMSLYNANQKNVRKKVVNIMKKVLQDAKAGQYVDSDYIKENYKDDLEEVRDLLNKKETEKDKFISNVSNSVDNSTFTLLTDFFLSEDTKDQIL